MTTILNATKPSKEQRQLERRIKAYDDMHYPGAWNTRMKIRSSQGMLIHLVASTYLTDGVEQVCLEVQDYWQSLKTFLDKMPVHQAIATEKTVCHPELGYAGTLDALIKFEKTEQLCLLDFKTFEGYELWNGSKQETWTPWRKSINKVLCPPLGKQPGWEWVSPRYRDALLQLAMYRMAAELEGHYIQQCFVLVVNRKTVHCLPLYSWLWENVKQEARARITQFHSSLQP